ncbi:MULTISPECIES: SRPBCC domain-containing protein [Streptomyces]|uniref:SRPBCC domain-containing protein n=1 Tax=Streptomyces TaxID=1883 RepID=UPI001E3034D4|nr:SRPBCC domain-containing protein [Streptomyces sp. OUCMDZ-3434]WDV30967.1 SRPBCC domain-containing protein [Streptomyces sp. AD16]WSB23199.1 SRPBCC domain-containing protein [Streptomyces albidoflavus]
MYTTHVTHRVHAPRAAVYRALLDPEAVARWRAPDGMTAEVHSFEPRVGGTFRISLTYDDPAYAGKSGEATDTYHGHFAELVPDERVVEVLAFETGAPGLDAPMRLTTVLTDASGAATDVHVTHENVPDSVPSADNETGTRMSLANLARVVEGGA